MTNTATEGDGDSHEEVVREIEETRSPPTSESETWLRASHDPSSARLHDPVEQRQSDDTAVFSSLRPQTFAEYVGQQSVKDNLNIACRAAKERGDAIDHILLHGPPGLGKTSLARIVARELGVKFKATSGPVIERPGDLAAILTSLEDFEVLFIDELHRLPRVVEEVLYSAMEDFELDILIGQGATAKSVKIGLPRFTLIGATTRAGLLTSPLRDRFGILLRLALYSPSELTTVATRSASLLNLELATEAAQVIGKRSRGTPRIANRLLKRVRDYAFHEGAAVVTAPLVERALALLDIDGRGLDKMDRDILSLLIEKFDGGPVGLSTIAAALGEEKGTLEDVYEPYLLQEGFLRRTPRGREASAAAYAHLGIEDTRSQLTLLPPK